MNDIPLIDMSPALEGSDDGRQAVALAIDTACREVGFFTLCGHGVPSSIFEDIFNLSHDFFERSKEEKAECRLDAGHALLEDSYTPYGYSGLLEENAFAFMGEQGKPSDYVEKLSVGRLILDTETRLPFPNDAAGMALRSAFQRYFVACEQVTNNLTELFTLALGLPVDFFSVRTNRSEDSLRSLLYPAASEAFANDQGMGAHADGTLLTILSQTSNGIEIFTRNGEWISPSVNHTDHFVVNIGDAMSRWANDEYVSTRHRVVLNSNKRQSAVFFKLVNDDAIIDCFPRFCQSRPQKYPAINYHQFALEKMNALFAQGTAA